MKQLSFYAILKHWFCAAIPLMLLNSFLIKSSLLENLIQASLGVVLLIHPVYPEALGYRYSVKTCRRIIRGIAVFEILLSFMVRHYY